MSNNRADREFEVWLLGERDGARIVSTPQRVVLRRERLWKRLWRTLLRRPAMLTNHEPITFPDLAAGTYTSLTAIDENGYTRSIRIPAAGRLKSE